MFEWQKISEFNCIVYPAKNKQNDVKKSPCVILFHGYGADADDLAQLQEVLRTKNSCTWVFPQGPLNVMIAPGYTGRAWFQIDIASLEKAIKEGKHRDLSDTVPPGFAEMSARTQNFYAECCNKYSAVVVGGFSQGAMLATEVTMRAQEKPLALVALSGALIDKDNWKKLGESCEGVPFFQSHGVNDAILSYKGAEDLESLFLSSEMSGKLISFHGGHEIPPQVLSELSKFLQSCGL